MAIEFITGFGISLGYFLICASSGLILRRFIKPPKEVFRKTLHLILLGSIFIWLYAFKTWWVSALAAVGFTVLVFPILAFAERIPGYSALLVERKNGEIKKSLVIVFGMFAALICVGWGVFGEKQFVLAPVLGWGLGDGAAALVGKRFGRHHLEGKMIEGRKSVEGSAAMFVMSFAAVIVVLLLNGAVPWIGCLSIAALTAAACTVVELYTKNGMDTLTCPFTAAAVLIPLVRLWELMF
jgi:dolichol kinase